MPLGHRPATVPRRQHRPLPGARVVAGRWMLLDQVGAGATASVWRARDLSTGELVAAKVLGRHTGALLARFWREQEVRVRHPHLVTATGWAAEEDVVLMTSDLCAGGSVQRLLDEHGPLPDGVVATILEQVLLGLAAVHAHGLLHRDVKPGNLLVEVTDDRRLHVRLADFGLALDSEAPRLTVAGPVGSAGYVPPEVLAGTTTPHPGQDLYAVGALGVHLLTGHPPHADLPVPATPLRGALAALLATDPEARPASAEAALALVRRVGLTPEPGPWVRDRLGPAPDELAPPRAGLGTRSARAAAWVTLVLAVLVTVGCLAWSAVTLVGLLTTT